MKKTDLFWVFAYPLYQLIGTFRHEASHALVAWLGGAQITKFVIWPTVLANGGFRWGYVQFSGNASWLTLAATYFFDLITFLLFFWICMRPPFKSRSLWVNAMIIGLISPFFNSLYNYLGGLNAMNDVGKLLSSLPDFAVHLYFIFTLLLYFAGLIIVFRFSPTARARNSTNS
ncbi:MAG: hypothetical protein HON98_09190 [Chloroflexi bacterium]|jgi:hypothetical protein|nr:hypothetical protein [Chloroflexota bacterium]MBT3668960.1 hypothetical protein [Chloroflexota bacterium]MBT4002116.1 hypothetical protein [Chloroflexota bacterium]MBT4304931.1 hypothetical protein [Chloroflexota bacterium]MBT4533306.1 hypothetical protein [Chloroflexota bacterium]